MLRAFARLAPGTSPSLSWPGGQLSAPGQLVDIGGDRLHRLRVGRSTPTVVLEAAHADTDQVLRTVRGSASVVEFLASDDVERIVGERTAVVSAIRSCQTAS